MAINAKYQYDPDYAIHPGEILQETLESRRMKHSELAERCNLTKKTISQIVNCKASISPETAIQLERVLGISSNIWNNLDATFRLHEAKINSRKELAKHSVWVRKFPVNEIVKRGFIEKGLDSASIIEALLDFFGVGNMDSWNKRFDKMAVAFRKSPSFKSSPESIATYIRMGELIANTIDTFDYDEKKFKYSLETIRGLTDKNPDVFERRMKELCVESGVSLVFLSELPKTYLSGVTKWLNPRKAMILLSLRYKSNDHFWFSFFHEAMHILYHSKKRTFLDEINMQSTEEEKEADKYASNMLLPEQEYNDFIEEKRYQTIIGVKSYANEMRIAPGIVVGRLQHDKIIPYSRYNSLKRKFTLVECEHNI